MLPIEFPRRFDDGATLIMITLTWAKLNTSNVGCPESVLATIRHSE